MERERACILGVFSNGMNLQRRRRPSVRRRSKAEMDTSVVIENEAMRIVLQPEYGARVVSLLDKASGRDWIFAGPQSRNTGEAAVYGGDEAVGWDECFPTISPWDASATGWKRRLRDHGDVWGRPWRRDDVTGSGTMMIGSGITEMVRSATGTGKRIE